MTKIQRADAEALATLVRRMRPDWNQAGTVAAIQRCTTGAFSEVAVALIRLAEDGTVRSPDLLNTAGHWWFRAAKGEQPAGEAIRHRDTCHVHPGWDRTTCQPCADERGPTLTPEQVAENAAQLRALIADKQRQVRELNAERRRLQGAKP